MDLSIGLGLAAAFCWGSSDFVVKVSTGKIGYLRTALFMQYIGGVFLLLFTFQDLPLLWRHPEATLVAVLLGLLNTGATLSLFKGFEVGQLSIISPVASSYPALSTILAVWFLNESVSGPIFFGILAILVGIILVSSQRSKKTSEKRKLVATGVGYALGAFFCMGLLFFGFKLVVSDLGSYLPVLMLRIVTALILTIVFLARRRRSAVLDSKSLTIVAIIGVVDTIANLAYTTGVNSGTVAVVSTLSGLFSTVTVLLACFLLKEKPALHQVIGFLTLLLGIGVIGYLT